jgi:hypothetical protein
VSTIHAARGGWWHDYVCPTHGVELDPASGASGDLYPCRYGCRLRGEPYASAWVVLEHQARAREARLLARRYADGNGAADREHAVQILVDFAGYYAEVAAGGHSERAEPWMLPGRLFSQALTEAIWSVQIADAALALAPCPTARGELGGPVIAMLTNLLQTVSDAWTTLVVDRDDPANNYVAWLDAAGGLLSRALVALGHSADPGVDTGTGTWVTRTLDHLRLATGDDGWEWEGSTYYHLFVLRAYLLNLRDSDPAALPPGDVERLAAMVRVLATLAGPDGALPMVHDGPYDRAGAHLEVLEICALASQLWASTGLERVQAWARTRLGATHDGLEDSLAGWFAGPPLPALSCKRDSAHFARAGYVVLRDSADHWTAILDAGPHGGSHGHLDKLGLYFYGDAVAWQPAPGVPPYASALRHGYYSRTVAHPTVRVDEVDQVPASGVVEAWEPTHAAPAATADNSDDANGQVALATRTCTRVRASAGDAIAGVTLTRELVMTDQYLLDVVHAIVTDGAERDITLGLRPAVPLRVTALAGGWRTTWAGPGGGDPRDLHGVHRASVPATLTAVPGRGPSDDPASPVVVGDWTAHARDVHFVSVYAPAECGEVADIDLVPGGGGALRSVRVHLARGTTIEHEVGR